MVAAGAGRHCRMSAFLQQAAGQDGGSLGIMAGLDPWPVVAIFVAITGELLALVFVMRVLTRGGSPASTLLWMVVILAAPWIGLALYYLLPHRLQLRRLRRRQNRLAWIEGSLEQLSPPRRDQGSRPIGRERLIQAIDPDGLHEGNGLTWLPSGPDFVRAMNEAIAAARHFVHLEMYIFRPDAAGQALLAALTEAARRGVEVRLLYDSFGSWGLKAAHLQTLREAGGRAEAWLPILWKRRPFTLNLRNHRKLLVVDGRLAILGGRNVGDEYARDRMPAGRVWLDAMVQVEGPAVTRLHRVFVEDWANAAVEDLANERYFPPVAASGEDEVGVLLSGPDLEVNGLWWVGFDLIARARETIDISSPYLVPPPTLLFALKVAAGRGVRVRIQTNGPKIESLVLYHAQRSYYREWLAAGVEIHETRDYYNHAKYMVVDGLHLLVGSANLDMRSAHWNFELGILAMDTQVAATAVATYDERQQGCCAVTGEGLPTNLWKRGFDGLCRLLSPLL